MTKAEQPIMVKCPHCGQEFTYTETKKLGHRVPTHDFPKPCRSVCPGSGKTPQGIGDDVNKAPKMTKLDQVADLLEEWKQRVCRANELSEEQLATSGFANLAFNYSDIITKAIRFMEDMTTLESVDVQIERGDQPDDQWLITLSPDCEGEVQFQDRSIITAARAAAQQVKETA